MARWWFNIGNQPYTLEELPTLVLVPYNQGLLPVQVSAEDNHLVFSIGERSMRWPLQEGSYVFFASADYFEG